MDMPYTVTSKVTGHFFVCETVSETIERAVDLISHGVPAT
jgi:hypothetical protein